jgi:hypothetical protein
MNLLVLPPSYTTSQPNIMDYSNDWDLQAVVRSCGSASELAAPAPAPAPARQDDAGRGGICRVGRAAAAAAPEFLVGRPVRPAAALRDLDYLDLDHELPRAPFSITPSSGGERGPLEHEVLISFPAASTSGQQQQLLQPRKQPGRKPGVRTPSRPKRRYTSSDDFLFHMLGEDEFHC